MVFGSGTLVAQLTDARLIDEYQFILRPVAIGEGRTMFEGITQPLNLKLTELQRFRSGIVHLRYEPAPLLT